MQIDNQEILPQTSQLPYGKIYRLTNKINGKMYHGQTTGADINNRWKKYKYLLCKGQKKLYPALKKYGWDNFLAEIVDITPQNQEQLDDLEIFYIAKFDSMNNGYNCDPGGYGRGKLFSKETLKKMSVAHSGINNHNFGKHFSSETRKKMSLAQMGEKNHRFGTQSSMLGKHHSDIVKQTISESMKKIYSNKPGTFLGRTHTEATKLKMSIAHTKKKN